MEKTYTGYQYDNTGRYIGPYQFVSTPDTPHIPPNTTLISPPPYDVGQIPYWQNGSWAILPDPYYNGHTAPAPEENSGT